MKVGDVLYEAGTYAKPVICRCCGAQKYLEAKPRVTRYTVTKVFRANPMLAEMSLDDGARTVMSDAHEGNLFEDRAKAKAKAKVAAKWLTKVNREQYLERRKR